MIDSELNDFMKLWLREYINDYCFERVAPGKSPLKSADPSRHHVWALYLSNGLYNAKFMNYVGLLFWERYADEYKNKKFQVAAMEPRSTPLLSAIATTAPLFKIDVNCFSIREEKRDDMLENIFEGMVEDIPVMIVNETSNENNILGIARETLVNEGLTLYKNAFTIINIDVMGNREGFDPSIDPMYPVDSLFKLRDFDYLYNDYISRNERYLQ